MGPAGVLVVDLATLGPPKDHEENPVLILDPDDPKHTEAARRLQEEPIIWLTTVTKAGQPQSTPVWFLWDGEEFSIYGSMDGPKTRNIERNPRVSLHLDGNGRGGGNVIFEGTARVDADGPRADAVPAFLDKYDSLIAQRWTPASFADEYPHLILVVPTRIRIW
jgi:PPOX class probable F420-dependent enzyme